MARDSSFRTTALCLLLSALFTVALVAQTATPPPIGVARPATPQTQLPGRGRANQPPPPPLVYTGLIVGRVIDTVSGKPIAGALVALNGGPARVAAPAPVAGQPPLAPLPPPRMLTDDEGRFAFRNLARGSYTLSSTKVGYAAGAYGRTRPEGAGRPVQLDDGERMSDVNIRMLKFAAIEGRITDEAGEPIVGATVRTYRRQLSSGRRVLTTGPNVQSDDRGVYRFFNLLPGEYLVSVPMSAASAPVGGNITNEGRQNFSATAQMMINGGPPLGAGGIILSPDARFAYMGMTASPALMADGSGRWRSYATTFYPTGSTSTTAEKIAVASGEERTGVDITMRYVPTSSISGIVTSPLGPAANYALRLLPADTSDWSTETEVAVTATDNSGQFMFLGVPAGQYVIQSVRVPREGLVVFEPATRAANGTVNLNVAQPQPKPQEPLLWGLTPVTVGDGDVGGVGVVMREGLTVSGRVEFTGSKPKPDAQRLTQIPLVLESATGRDNLPTNGPSSRVTADGKFFTGAKLPGKYFLRVGGSPSGFIVQSITANGVDATDVPIDLTSNVTSVVITFTDLISDIRGTVRGVPAGSDPAAVVLFPADSTAWKDFGINPLRMKLTRANATGTYAFGSLVSGDYYAVAIRDEFSTEWNDAAFLEVLSRTAQRFTLGLGEHRTLDLQLSDARPPGIGRAPVASAAPLASGTATPGREPGSEPRVHGPALLDEQTPQVRDVRPPSESVGTGSISGRVLLDDGTNRPARLARVSVSGGALTAERYVLTDDEGRFTVAWLPPGSYQLMAVKAAYLGMFYGGKRPGTGPGTPIKVEARQAVTGIDVSIPKGAVISGTVLDPTGQPAASVRIQLQTFTRRDGTRMLTSASFTGPSTTDDRGNYRLYGLRPGTYVLSAVPTNPAPASEIRQLSEQEMRAALADAARGIKPPALADPPRTILPAPTATIPAPEPGGRSVGFSPVFYPGALREQDAAEVVLVAGQEMTGVNIQLMMLPVARLEGVVFGIPNGQPVAQPQLSLQRINGSSAVSTQGVRYQNGAFQAISVPAGHYILTATMEQPQPRPPATPGVPSPPPPPAVVYWAQQEFDVAGADLLNLTLTLGPPMTLSGRVVFDGTQKPDPKTVSVRLEPVGLPAPIRTAAPAQIDAAGAFTLTGILPGRYRLSATSTAASAAPQQGPAWSVISSSVDNQDSLITPFEYRGNRQITNAVVTMTDQPAEVSVKLVDASDLPVLGMTVVLFPTDPVMWTMNSTRVNRRASSSTEGVYRFAATLPGDYYMAVLPDLDTNDWNEPTFKEQLAAQSMKLTVAKGQKLVQTLRVK